MSLSGRRLYRGDRSAMEFPDGKGGLVKFAPSGTTAKQFAAMGDLPRQHGLLGAMLEGTQPYRAPNVQEDPRFEGWPDAHPKMRSVLGVPILSRGRGAGPSVG